MRFAVLLALCATPAFAQVYSMPVHEGVVTSSMPTVYQETRTLNLYSGSDQDRCQAEANYMATRGITGHVGSVIGRFEGVGFGHSPNCNTCTPGNGMRLTGDACAQGRNGLWYRVRSWR